MKYPEDNIAVARYENLKYAALYFDYVISIFPNFLYPSDEESNQRKQAYDLFPWHLGEEFVVGVGHHIGHKGKFDLAILAEAKGVISEKKVHKFAEKLSATTADWFKKCNLRRFPAFVRRDLGSPPVIVKSEGDDVLVSLIQLNLVDLTNTSWEHLLEFREDGESKKSLRRMRLFLFENYTDKSRNYIQDDLLQKLDDYEDAVKKWGFETITSSLSFLITSKSLITTVVAAFVSALLGRTELLTASLLAGTAIELGKIAIHIGQRGYELKDMITRHPLSYIIQARDDLE